jgi:hypothetical protein
MKQLIGILFLATLVLPACAQINNRLHNYELRAIYETGALRFQNHSIRFGPEGTTFDYVQNGGQKNLFPFQRGSFELHLKPRHTFLFLYQPLDVRTLTTLPEQLILDSDTFPAGTPMSLRYGFDFYRVSWLYDLFAAVDQELAVGLSLQLRNAAISFTALDGTKQRVYNNLGPVPALKARIRLPLNSNLWWAAEVDGIYAQGTFVTGSTNVESSFKGAILDGSLRLGTPINRFLDGFVNLRYLGGGAEGTQKKPENPNSSGFTANWLGIVVFSLGIIAH